MLQCDLIIPAYNEQPNIKPLFQALEPVRHLFRHIVLADNDSSDATAAIAQQCGAVVVHEAQRGYGAACLAAIAWISEHDDPPDALAFVDADLSDDPAALHDVLQPIARGKAEIVIGSRVRRADPGALNFVQRFGNGLACRLMHWLTGRRYSDLGPMRAVRWQSYQRLGMQDRTWGWTVEMQMKAALLDIPVEEVDVPYRSRRHGRSKISGTVRGVTAAGIMIISTILLLWWQRRRFRDHARTQTQQPSRTRTRPTPQTHACEHSPQDS